MVKSGNLAARLYRFKELSRLIRPFFKLENIELSFSGLERMLHEYDNLDSFNPQQSFAVIRDLLLWIDYLQELHCVIKTSLMKLENRNLYLEAFKVGEGTPKINKLISETKSNRELCGYYEKELTIQIKFLHNAYKCAITEYNEHIRK